MLKKFSAFVCAFALTASFAWAQDEASSESTDESTEVYYPQSEVVSVLNATDENGNYVAEWSGDNVVLRFKFTYPSAEEFDGKAVCYLGIYNPTTTKANVEGYVPLNPSGTNSKYNNNVYFRSLSHVSEGGVVYPYQALDYIKDNVGSVSYYNDYSLNDDGYSCSLSVTLPYMVRGGQPLCFIGDTITFAVDNLCAFYKTTGMPSILRKYATGTYKFVVAEDDNHIAVSENTNTSELGASDGSYIYVNNPAVLSVDNDFSCLKVFVRSGDEAANGLAGGLVINEGASFNADSVYYLANKNDDRSLAYLINNGSYNSGTVFVKGATNEIKLGKNFAKKYGYIEATGYGDDEWYYSMTNFSNPMSSMSVPNWIDMSFRDVWVSSRKSSGIVVPYLDGGNIFSMFYDWNSLSSVPLFQPMYLVCKYGGQETINVRMAGSVNDENAYEMTIEDVNPEGVYDEGQVKTFINNPYQAPIDWRSISETAGDQFVNDVKDVHVSYVMHSLYSMYNLKTGFTTFDAPGKMYYGYLQPQISNAQLVHQNGNQSVVTVSKSDVCSYAMADEKYGKSDIVDYPYIRLYVDEIDEAVQKGEGLRSVVVLYFVPGDKYDELHNSETTADYDANYGINTVWETLAETCYNSEFYGGGYIFPYLGAYEPCQTKSDKAAVIKMVKMPIEVSEQYKGYSSALADFIRVSVDKNMSEGAVKLGVLDYNLGDSELGICLGDIALNYPGRDNNLSMNINVKDGYVESEPSSLVSTNRSFEADKVYDRWDCKQLSLNLNIAQVDRTADKKVTTPNASAIKSSKGQIYVNSSVSGTLSVYDLAGRLIAEKSAEGSVSVSVPDGVYVAAYSSANSTVRSRVAVK